MAWQPSIYLGWLLKQNPHVKYAMLEKTQLFVSSITYPVSALGLLSKDDTFDITRRFKEWMMNGIMGMASIHIM